MHRAIVAPSSASASEAASFDAPASRPSPPSPALASTRASAASEGLGSSAASVCDEPSGGASASAASSMLPPSVVGAGEALSGPLVRSSKPQMSAQPTRLETSANAKPMAKALRGAVAFEARVFIVSSVARPCSPSSVDGHPRGLHSDRRSDRHARSRRGEVEQRAPPDERGGHDEDHGGRGRLGVRGLAVRYALRVAHIRLTPGTPAERGLVLRVRSEPEDAADHEADDAGAADGDACDALPLAVPRGSLGSARRGVGRSGRRYRRRDRGRRAGQEHDALVTVLLAFADDEGPLLVRLSGSPEREVVRAGIDGERYPFELVGQRLAV